jgi:hypothetical protein
MSKDVRRRLELYAANPRCDANVRAALGGVPMLEVARHLGLEPAFGQSPFALQRGQTFERTLFEDDATPLRRALIERKVLPANAAGFVDLRLRRGGGPVETLDAAATAFEALLRRWAGTTGDPRLQLPTLVAGATLRTPGEVLGDGLLALDVLTVHPESRPAPITLRVGEVKVYPDRGGFTDSQELAAARAQAGLYVYVLQRTVETLGLTRDLHVAEDGFLVLARPASNQPSVRAGEDLAFQAARAREMFARLGPVQADLSAGRIDARAVLAAPKRYGDACLSFCELADHCRDEALRAGLPTALGEDLARFLGDVSLHRALELLHGDEAVSEAERDFLRRSR